MSRSRKRNPYHGWACHARGSMKRWKNQCNRRVRRASIYEEMGNLGFIRRMNERYSAPDDGKVRATGEYIKKCLRK